jgi:hypothetical protein
MTDMTVVAGRGDGDRLLVPVDSLESSTGWQLKPEGLCQGDVCFPVRDPAGLVHGDEVDVRELAARVGRVAAIDAAEGVGVIGASAAERAESMTSLRAPSFTLPDLQGHPVHLDDFAGTKRLLLAFASW